MSGERAKKDLIDALDDGDSWTDGTLFKPVFKGLTVCYMLHAVCCHFHCFRADLLTYVQLLIRMNNF